MARVTQAMLERALGGAHVLVELLDKDGDGVADATAISEILDEADAEANSYISDVVNVADAQVASAPMLLLKEKARAVRLCWLRGTMAQAMPANIEPEAADAIRWYEAVQDRRANLGTATRVTSAHNVKQVTTPTSDGYYRTVDTSVGPPGPRGRYGGWA